MIEEYTKETATAAVKKFAADHGWPDPETYIKTLNGVTGVFAMSPDRREYASGFMTQAD